MRFITFDVAYLPDSDNIAKPVSCTVGIDHISLVLPLDGDISGAHTCITVGGRDVHVPQTPEEVGQLLNAAGSVAKATSRKSSQL